MLFLSSGLTIPAEIMVLKASSTEISKSLTGDVGPSLKPELEEKLLSVFIPTAPNPTTGWYTLVPESSVKDLDISVEDAFRTIISAGIVNPDEKNNNTNPTFSKLFSQLRASSNSSS